MTMNAPYAGSHPVSGTREFDYEQNSDGSYNFFVRGVDRFNSNIAESVAWATPFGNAFRAADTLWKSFQDNTCDFVNTNGGRSTISPIINNRPDWKKVDKVLKGERSLRELGCN